jgi:primosomal protein N' (replication factor Y)
LRALELRVPADMVALAEWVAAEYCSTLARALGLVLPPGAARRLGGRKHRSPASPARAPWARRARPPTLTVEQRRALRSLTAALMERAGPPRAPGERARTAGGEAPAHKRRLLQGVTGSGKTEVYLRLAEIALAQGRGAIVLVPEIALTPQIVERFTDRFGDTVAAMHSRQRTGERYAEWRRLRAGQARVCVGPRSAVFAPIEDVGLIVVDEEHDPSYKHEGDPRYDARHVAAERAARSDALLVLGSATPRPESAHGVRRSRLPRRVDGGPLPAVHVLDTRGQPHGLHPLTTHALADVRDARGKAVVLLNRRGWSNFLSCSSCGAVWSCPLCDVALVLHRAGGYLSCHHCGHREPVPASCGQCASTSLARHGAGTERLQHELALLLDDGGFPVFRLDSDVLGAASTDAGPEIAPAGPGRRGAASNAPAPAPEAGVGAVLSRFRQAECGALIGTQMVAKGHDFPHVALGVVLDADATLRFPDFRAEERTFALIAQLAGRVGRGGDGRVLVQTSAPQARSIVHAAGHDSDGFLRGELQHRRALGYPPFSHLIRIVCGAVESRRARGAARALRDQLFALPPGPNAAVLGPAALFRLRGRERQVVVVKAAERRQAVRAVDRAVRTVAGARAHPGVNFSVDVDPQ